MTEIEQQKAKPWYPGDGTHRRCDRCGASPIYPEYPGIYHHYNDCPNPRDYHGSREQFECVYRKERHELEPPRNLEY